MFEELRFGTFTTFAGCITAFLLKYSINLQYLRQKGKKELSMTSWYLFKQIQQISSYRLLRACVDYTCVHISAAR